jgi:hypothetical protein
MRLFLSATLACPMAIATPLLADCPTGPDDAVRGIETMYDDGMRIVIRALGDGVQQDEEYLEGDDGYFRIMAMHGIFSLEEAFFYEDSSEPHDFMTVTYADGVAALPLPKPGLNWHGSAQTDWHDGSGEAREIGVSVGQAERYEIGGCAYDSWPVTVSSSEEGWGETSYFRYLPQLKIAIFTGYAESGEEAVMSVPVRLSILD